MVNIYAGMIAMVGIFLIMGIGFFVISQSTADEDAAKVTRSVYRVRKYWFFALTLILLVTLGFTMPRAPNLDQFKETPQAVVAVNGKMWQWTLTPVSGATSADGMLVLGLNRTVEFRVTSSDVNHGFGIYNAAGTLLTQVQAMPGYTNRLLYRFHTPGLYSILCLEYCGVGHQVMVSQFKVE